MEELLDRRHELVEGLLLFVGEGLGEGEHLRRLEHAAEQVQGEGGARLGRRPGLRARLRRQRPVRYIRVYCHIHRYHLDQK